MSERADSYVGHEVTVTTDGVTVTGIVDEVRYPPSRMVHLGTGEESPCVQFHIRDHGWTVSYPDDLPTICKKQ